MPREMPITPADLMDLDRALAVVLLHNQGGQPWVIGPEAAVVDRAKRTVRYYADRTLWKETREATVQHQAGIDEHLPDNGQ